MRSRDRAMTGTNGEPAGRSAGRRVALTGLLLAGVASLLLLAAPAAFAGEPCPNAGLRVGASAVLHDCRAYEMVTEPNKDSGEVLAVPAGFFDSQLGGIAGMHASVTDEPMRMAWASEYPLPGSASPGLDYLSTRGAGGWSSENVIPPQSVENGLNCPVIVAMAAYSADLSKGVLADGFGQPGSFIESELLNCGHDEPRLVTGEPEGFQNLFLRDNEAPSYQLVNDAPAPASSSSTERYYPAAFLAGSADLSHVVFEEELPLTPEAGKGDELYEWVGGAVHLVSVLPGGRAAHGSLAGATRNTQLEHGVGGFEKIQVPFNLADARHAVSAAGSRVFFVAGDNLYLRENADQPPAEECAPGRACTIQVDEAQAGAAGPSGGGKFMVAAADGSRVFFTDENQLISDSTAEPGKPDLYEFNIGAPVGHRLTDLTVDSSEPADALGVSGASEDGSDVYFVAEGALTKVANGRGATAQAGQPNLYLAHAGTTTFIATLDASRDSCDWMSPRCVSAPLFGGVTARVSANGAFVGFDSVNSLTGYDNTGPSCVPILDGGSEVVHGFEPGSCEEIFLYDAAANTLGCASCDPNGAAPAGPAMIRFPAATSQDREMRNAYPQRNVSDNGQVFFETPDALVPGDTNGKRDVYEYEGGRQFLISSGTGEADSVFLDASANGSDVFFATAQRLLPRDGDGSYDIYDARVDGGFPEPAGAGAACEGEACAGAAAAAPAFSAASSLTSGGVGNVPPPAAGGPVVKQKPKLAKCRKGFVRKRTKCVRAKRERAKRPGNKRGTRR
jgi:hypothetical protein